MMVLAGALAGRARVAVLAAWAVVVLGLLVYGVHAGLRIGTGPAASAWLDGWLYSGLVLAGALGILARAALVRDERNAWILLGIAGLVWSAGDIYWWRVVSQMEAAPYPSGADWLYLAFYPFAYCGLVLLVRARVRRFHASQWLDGIAAGLVIAAAGAALVLPAVLAASTGSPAAVATNVAYPLGDLLLLALLGGLAGLMGWRPGRAIGLLSLGCAVFALADGAYLYQVAAGTYVEGRLLDVLWPAALAMMGFAAWQPASRAPSGRLEGWAVLAIPSAVAIGALGLLVLDHYRSDGHVVVWLAAAGLAVCLLRAGLTFRENIALADSHQRQAVTDALTGLPNRRLFRDRAEQAVLRARRQGERAAIMVIDLDRFKEVNDTLGHHSGDLLLQAIARRLKGVVRESDTVARLGGDEFGVLLPMVPDAQGAADVAALLHRTISEPTVVEGLSLATEPSIGIALFPDHGDDVAQLLQRADVAMYVAKSDGVGHQFYRPEQDSHSPERLALAGDLRRAIERGELVLHYQPKIDLVTGELSGVEALVRWEHPERGLLPPAAFIPLAEQTTLIKPLTLCVLNGALEQCRRWEMEGRQVSVAVNVSTRNLLDPDFPDAVAACLSLWQVPAERLELEITESVLMANPGRAREVLQRLSAIGVAIAIDDFGMGYSSLKYLKGLPVDVLKIDRSFVLNMSNNPADAMIVRSTIDLGRNLGLQVVAEGIEDAAAYAALRELGCDIGQGFLMARPMSPDEFGSWSLSPLGEATAISAQVIAS